MTKTLTLKIVGRTPIHGRKPGDVFEIEADDDGVPLELVWRKRLTDEIKFKVGSVQVVGAPPVTPATPPAPVSAPASPPAAPAPAAATSPAKRS